MVDWERVDTVLLDMDGTLLDLHYDNHFWLEHVPRRFAEHHGLELAAAHADLMARYTAVQGTIRWYSVDYWSDELGLDIAQLKQEVEHLIAVHPHVIDFLGQLRAGGRRSVLVTNAHGRSLALKFERTRLGRHLDDVVCAHDYGVPKEADAFWQCLADDRPFDRERTLFVDDSLAVLESAARYGIAQLLAVSRPDSRLPVREIEAFRAIEDFGALLPLPPHPSQREKRPRQ